MGKGAGGDRAEAAGAPGHAGEIRGSRGLHKRQGSRRRPHPTTPERADPERARAQVLGHALRRPSEILESLF